MRRLREHDQVILALPDERLLRSADCRLYVVAVFGSVAALHPVHPAALERLPATAEGAYISFWSDGHLVALRGNLLRRENAVQFRVSDGVTLPRRSSTRVEVMAPATMRRRDGSTGSGVTLDIALDGVLVETDLALVRGEEILLSLAMPTRDQPIEAAARVVRTVDRRAGVAFTSIDQDARRFLAGLIYERSLADLSLRFAGVVDDDDLF